MTERLCRICLDWHDLDEPWPVTCLPEAKSRSGLSAPSVISDIMNAVQSQATGEMYDSKSGIRAEYKQLKMEEVGNDPQRNKKFVRPKPDRKEIKITVEKATARFDRGERAGQTAA